MSALVNLFSSASEGIVISSYLSSSTSSFLASIFAWATTCVLLHLSYVGMFCCKLGALPPDTIGLVKFG